MMRCSSHATPLALTTAVLMAAAVSATAQTAPLGSPVPGQPLGQALEAEDARAPISFAAHQLSYPRVAGARDSADERLRAVFAEHGVDYPAAELFLRVFKHEREMEVWARSHPDAAFTRVRTYGVCALPGQLGPKRRMGDLQVPEGFYYIDDFNPVSEFHLSLRVSYPNTADRLRRDALSLGGDIFVHGGCATVGCVPIEDHNMEELYWLAVQATDAGQRLIPIHIFPARLDRANLRWLEETFSPDQELLDFWNNLQSGYAFFEETRRVPWVTVASNGEYAVPDRPALAADSVPLEGLLSELLVLPGAAAARADSAGGAPAGTGGGGGGSPR